MARPRKEFDVEALLADWKTGRYEGRSGVDKLASLYGVSRNIVYNTIRDCEASNKELCDKIVSVNQSLNGLCDKDFNSVMKHADRETRLKNRRDKIVELAFDAIEEKLQDADKRKELSTYDIKTLVEASDKNCVTAEIAPRFSNNGVTVNATAQAGIQQTEQQKPVIVQFVGE